MSKKNIRKPIQLSEDKYKIFEEWKYDKHCRSFNELIVAIADDERQKDRAIEEYKRLNNFYLDIIKNLVSEIPLTEEQQRVANIFKKEKNQIE